MHFKHNHIWKYWLVLTFLLTALPVRAQEKDSEQPTAPQQSPPSQESPQNQPAEVPSAESTVEESASSSEGGTNSLQGAAERSSASASGPTVSPFNGSLSQVYPIGVPAGRGAVTPSLTLVYNSSRGNGFCGMGWGLDMPHINRVGERNAVPNYSSTDKFVMSMNGSGGDLILMSGAAFTNGAVYHTKTESFTKIIYKTTEALKDHFEVQGIDGVVYSFGTSADGRLSNAGTPAIGSVWYLKGVVDALGNTCTYEYDNTPGETKGLLKRVLWGAVEGRADENLYKVELAYDANRPDRADSYRRTQDGEYTNKRISIIEVFHKVKENWMLLWKYQLEYDQSPATNRTRLVAVRKLTPNGEDFTPKTQFGYTSKSPGWQPPIPWEILDESGNLLQKTDPKYPYFVYKWRVEMSSGGATGRWDNVYEKGVRLIDVNGDGLTDILVSREKWRDWNNSDGVTQAVFLNMGQGVTSSGQSVIRFKLQSQSQWRIPTAFVGILSTDVTGFNPGPAETTMDYGVRFGDVNGDARPDIIVMREMGWLDIHKEYYRNSGEPRREIYLAKPDGGWQQTPLAPWSFPGLQGGMNVVFVYSYGVIDNKSSPGYYGSWRNVDIGLQLVDMDGDGRDDLVLGRDSERIVYRNTGSGWVSNNWSVPKPFTFGSLEVVPREPYIPYAAQSGDLGIRLTDVNSDGLPDMLESVRLLYTRSNEDFNNRSVSYNKGKGWGSTDSRWTVPPTNFTTFIDSDGKPFGCDNGCVSSFRNSDLGVRLLDVNGDGMLDIVYSFKNRMR